MSERKAILTGSLNYQESPLQYPEKDIELISNVLIKRCHFEQNDINTILHTNKVSDENYIEKLKNACKELNATRNDVYHLVLFYYSGHGIYKASEQMSFLQISDNYSVPIDEIIQIVSEVKAKNKYFIVDACQSGGVSLKQVKGKIDRKFIYNSEGIYCMFGATKYLSAYEPSSRDLKKQINNSYYTHFIAEALNNKKNYYPHNTISIGVVDDYTKQQTPKHTDFEQIPTSTTEVVGYFPLGFWEEAEELEDIGEWKINNNIQYVLKDEAVDYLVELIQRNFINNSSFQSELFANLSQQQKQLLNSKLNLPNKEFEKKPLINGLIANPEKRAFLFSLLENTNIEINLFLKDNNGKTALLEAVSKEYYTLVIRKMFVRGYSLNDEETIFLENLFSQSVPNYVLENAALALIYNKLNKKDLIIRTIENNIEKIILYMYSFKRNKIIGFNVNYLALANTFLQSYKNYSTLFIKALKLYGYYDEFLKKDSFKKKLNVILEEKPYQETKNDDIFKILFPELFEVL